MSSLLLADSALRSVHGWFAWVVVVLNTAAGAWALAAHRFEHLRRRELWWFTAAAQGTIVAQVVIGVVVRQQLFAGDDPEHLQIHMFYGFIALFAMAILYSYRSQLRDHLYLLYGFGGLFLTGLALRAIYLR